MRKGIALVNALLISLVVGVGLLLLYGTLMKFFRTAETSRVFSSVREAAKSGVEYAISNLEQFSQQLQTSQTGSISTTLPCRIEGRPNCIINLQIIIAGNVATAGQEASGSMYEPFGGSFSSTSFLIRSEAISGDQRSLVEALVQK